RAPLERTGTGTRLVPRLGAEVGRMTSPPPSPLGALRAIAASALIGTDRSGQGKDAAGKLLHRAAALGAQARAGWKPRIGTGTLPRCPDDPRPAAPAAAMATLLGLMSGSNPDLIEEWSQLAHARGMRVADSAVPAVLDWWARYHASADVTFQVLGKRGE